MALPKPSPGLLPAENYSRFGRAFDAIDAAASAAAAALSAAAAAAPLSALDGRRYEFVPPRSRPGDNPTAFTLVASLSQLGGLGDTLPAIPASVIAFGDAGGVVRLRGAGIVASRAAYPVEPGRAYTARFAYQRRANPSDPSNDSVRFILIWLDQAKNVLAGTPFTIVFDDQTLTTASGRQEVGVSFARSPGAGLLAAPVGACYVRPAIECFGLDGLTDIEIIDRVDSTDATLLDPVSTDLTNRVGTLESQNPGPRLSEIEALLGTPNSKAFLTKSDAQSGTIPSTVSTVLLFGRNSPGDGYEGRFKRISGAPPAESDTFVNAGQTWVRVLPDREALGASVSGQAVLSGTAAQGASALGLGSADAPAFAGLQIGGRPVLGLREINAGDPQYAGGVIPDCTGVGIGTDAGPALRAAAAAWVAAGPGSVLRVPTGRYRIATAVNFNLAGQVGMVFDASDAVFTPDAAGFRVFDFHNGLQAVIKARFVEGGPFAGWGAAQPYPVNYGNQADVVDIGGQEAIRVSGVSGYTVDLTGENYAGRLLRVARARNGEPTTGGIKGVIRTSRGSSLSKPRVGQSLFTDNGTSGYTGFWGHLDGLHNDFDAWAPVWRDVNDVAVTYFDGAYAYTGPSLQGVGVFKGGVVYVGDIDSNTNNVHLDVSPSPATGRLSNRISINQLTMLNAGNGLVVNTPDPSARAIDIRHVTMVGAGMIGSVDLSFGNAVTLNNAKGVLIGAIVGEGFGGSLLAVTGAASDDVRVGLYAKGLAGNFAYIAPEVTGRVQISGRMSDPVPGRSVLAIGGDTPVRLSDFDVSASNGSSLINISSASNKVRWVSGSKSGTATTYADRTPAYVNPSVDIQ